MDSEGIEKGAEEDTEGFTKMAYESKGIKFRTAVIFLLILRTSNAHS